ncbi:MAG: sigma-54 dependent transcriptional regulator [Candidatus Wallbacteria bacterium]|nr:sigma-54 dependent transcriptional regulator [Candidatus Wallbacteria bacterium]
MKNIKTYLISMLSSEGATAAALYLKAHPEVNLVISSAGKLPDKLDFLSHDKGAQIVILGLGYYERFEEMSTALRKLSSSGCTILWLNCKLDLSEIKGLKLKNLEFREDFSKEISELTADYLKKDADKSILCCLDKDQGWANLYEDAAFRVFNLRDYDVYPAFISKLAGISDLDADDKAVKAGKGFSSNHLLGRAQVMKDLKDSIADIGMDSLCSVLIHGETGTGKETVALALHRASKRKCRPFIAVNCANFTAGFLDSELFGHEKGSFTGATERRIGLMEEADTGTLFLDEIGEMPLDLQPKLLRVLDHKRFRRLGGSADLKVDVRIISATNRDLARACNEGKFRSDLYYRLSETTILTPALREHREDIPLIAHHILRSICDMRERELIQLDKNMKQKLMALDWPGNVRELHNRLIHAVIRNNWSFSAAPGKESDTGIQTLEQHSIEYIRKIYELMNKNQTHTARALDISINTLKKYL